MKKKKPKELQMITELKVGDMVVLDGGCDIALVTSRPGEEVEAQEEPAPVIPCQAVAPRPRRGPLRLVSLGVALRKAGINLN